jgi:hypothetical protein
MLQQTEIPGLSLPVTQVIRVIHAEPIFCCHIPDLNRFSITCLPKEISAQHNVYFKYGTPVLEKSKEFFEIFEQFISEYFISFLHWMCKIMQTKWARSSAWIERLPSKFNKESRKSRDRSPPGPYL